MFPLARVPGRFVDGAAAGAKRAEVERCGQSILTDITLIAAGSKPTLLRHDVPGKAGLAPSGRRAHAARFTSIVRCESELKRARRAR